MSTIELLAQLRNLGIRLWAENERLRYHAPEGALTAELRAAIVTRKAEILAFLAQAASATQPIAAAIPPTDRAAPLPLSFAQERLWFIDQLQPGSNAYNMPQVVRLRGRLDSAALRASLSEVVRRHEVLRTTFSADNDDRAGQPGTRWVQIIHPPADVALAYQDLSALPAAEREIAARQLANAETARPLDLQHGPLLRAMLIRTGDDEHLLVLTLHHIVSDGWSTGLLIRELTTLYSAAVRGAPIAAILPPLSIQYADYAVWQRQALAGDKLRAELDYWRQQLASAPALLELPTDRPRPAQQTFNGAIETAPIPATLLAGLTALSQREDATPFMTLLAAFQVLLHRYTSQRDIVVGSPISGRSHAELEGLIGFFVNMLALRLDLRGRVPSGWSFRELLRRVRETTLGAYAHQDVPFEKIVEAVQPERALNHAPIFQVVFMLQYAAPASYQLPDLELSALELDHTVAKFDLALSLNESPDGMTATIEYNTDLFERATITRMLAHYAMLLGAIVADPDQPIGALSLLTEAERAQLQGWQGPISAADETRCAHELFAAQAARTPDAIAVAFVGANGETEQLSYAELDQRSNLLASELRRRLPANREHLIGLFLDRSPELIVAILGVLKAGAAYVPLDPTYPVERLRFMLSDADVAIVLTQPQLGEQLAALVPAQAQILTIDSEWPASDDAARDLQLAVTPDQLAYVIYTSGSTGRPKGVLVPHRGIGNLAQAQIAAFDVRPGSRVLQFAALSFDAAVSEIWMALLGGATLYLAPRELLLPGPGLIDLFKQHAINIVTLPPSALAELPVADLPDLRTLALAGEAASPELIARWSRDGRRMLNAYGPTETTVCATIAIDPGSQQRPPIGRPLANTQAYVLDAQLQPMPIGLPGELYVGGVGVARGYLKRPDLTAERFVPDPFASNPGSRLYRTGDLARWRPDGMLDYLGRRDEQVKLRGFRIEIGEIEAVLATHPAIRQCAVLAREIGGNTRLVAYVTEEPRTKNLEPRMTEQGNKETKEQRTKNKEQDERTNVSTIIPPSPVATGEGGEGLRNFLQDRLPAYMIPSAFVLLDALPVTPSGKLDRKALPEPGTSQALGADGVEPRDRWELHLARLWQELLHSGPLSIHDNFFRRGGDSLLAARLVARIGQELGRQIPVARLIGAPTIAQIAALLRQQPTDQPWSPLVEIQPGADRPPLFCVHPIGGHVLCYVTLAQQIGPEQPVFGLQVRGLEDNQEPSRTIAEMAAEYLAALREVQPHGPYLLLGWSFGGVVAFEMAQQLLRDGEAIALLAIVDSSLDPPIKAAPTPAEEVLNLAWGMGGIFGKELGITAEDLAGLDQAQQLQFLLERAQSQEVVPADLGLDQLQRYLGVFRASIEAAHSYVPRAYPQPMLLLQAEQADPERQAVLVADWHAVAAGGLSVERVPGNHYSMMRQPERMAELLRHEIERILAEDATISTSPNA
ncbi:MAG: amino acid adenylation domain-containing protein [Chloroflexi bacterium]|nr:amino acid adenylation domain-containing protein [Chloroflexota bacterium]